MKLFEFTSDAYHPTQNERIVLSLCLICDTPQLAASQSSKTYQLSYARKMLIQLGFISGDDGAITLTDLGNQLCVQQALSDELGGASDDAVKLASTITN